MKGVLFVITIIAYLAVQYKMKLILKQKGFKTDYFLKHVTDIGNFYRLIRQTPSNTEEKRKYVVIYAVLFACILLIIFEMYFVIFKSIKF
jgi:hypothetical protein